MYSSAASCCYMCGCISSVSWRFAWAAPAILTDLQHRLFGHSFPSFSLTQNPDKLFVRNLRYTVTHGMGLGFSFNFVLIIIAKYVNRFISVCYPYTLQMWETNCLWQVTKQLPSRSLIACFNFVFSKSVCILEVIKRHHLYGFHPIPCSIGHVWHEVRTSTWSPI